MKRTLFKKSHIRRLSAIVRSCMKHGKFFLIKEQDRRKTPILLLRDIRAYIQNASRFEMLAGVNQRLQTTCVQSQAEHVKPEYYK